MARLILKKSSVLENGAPKQPAPGDLEYGELALNYAVGTLYYKKSDNTIGAIGAGASPGNGTLSLEAQAGLTNTSVSIGTGTGFSANTATNTTYQVNVGPALSALAGTMTGAGSGFIKKTGADTYEIDTNTYVSSAALANYLPLAGGTLSGDLIINSSGLATSPALRINLSDSGSAFLHAQESIAANLTANQSIIHVLGVAASTKNAGYIGYKYSGTAASDNNLLTFGHWGSDHLMTLDGGGNLIITGNLTVNGTTTTINSTTVAIDDLNLQLATDAPTAAAANGAGISIGGAGATFTYASSGDKWQLNKSLEINGSQVWHAGNLTNLNQLTNGPGYITGYTETDTLATVTGRGATTTQPMVINANDGLKVTYDTSDGDTWYRGWGIESNRAAAYYRPVNNNTQTLRIGYSEGTQSWNTVRVDATNFTQNGNQVLHAGNYSSYALPLTGGTITGAIVAANNTVGGVFGNLEVGYNGYYNTLQTKTSSDTLWLQYAHAGPIGIGYGGGSTTFYGRATFQNSIDTRPQFPGGILGLDTGDGNFDIWGISRNYYPSNETAANAWGIRWDGDSNQVRFIGGGTVRLAVDLDGGASALTWEGNAVLNSSNYSSYALPLTGGTTTGVTLGVRVNSSSYGGNTGGMSGHSFPAEIRANGAKPTLTWHYEDIATRHIALDSDGALNVYNPGESGGAVFKVGGNTALHAGNYNSYAPTLTGGGASGSWGINITGNAATATTLQTARNINGTSFNGSADITTVNWGTSRNITIGRTSRSVNGSADVTWDVADIGLPDGANSVRQWTVAANGAQGRRHTIARVYGTPNHWINTWQNIRIKILQEDYSSGYVEYNLFGYYGMGNGNSWILRLKEADGVNTSYFRVSLGTVTYAGWQYSGQNTYYQDIYIDVDYYTTVRVIATTYGHGYQTTNPTDGTSGCYTVFYDSPATLDITYTNDDKSSTYHFGDKILNAANYNSYSPTLTGGGASGTWGINITGTAAGINTSAPTLAIATEANSIYVSAPSYSTGLIVKQLNFDWYGNYWAIGNIRSGDTASNGFGVAYGNNTPLFVFSNTGNGFQAGNAFTYDNSGGWGANLVAAGSYHARVRLRATSYNGSGDRETYMWLDNTVNPATGIHSDAPFFNFRGSITTVQVAGNTVLHAGNYNTYSPTLTGGGASGTWGISITGNAGSAGSVPWSGITSIPALWYQSGSWLGDLGSNGFTRENGVSMTGGAEFVLLSNGGRGYTLVDGSYYAYESGGFYSSNNSAYGTLLGFYADTTTSLNFNTTSVKLSGNQILHASNYSSYALPLTGGTISGNGYIDFGPNSTWASTLRVGGNGWGGTGRASVVTTNGNLHLDSSASDRDTYINYYTNGAIRMGSGAHIALHAGNYTSYLHSFDSLTGKTAGTGDYMTTGSFIAQNILRVQNGGADWDSLDLNADGATHYINARGAETGLEFQFDGVTRMSLSNAGSLNLPNGGLTALTKSFLIPHPTKPNKKLRYGSLEGPENGVYVRGRLQGTDCIQLPEYWTKLVDPDSITVQLTPRGKPQQLYVREVGDNCVWVDIDGAWTSDIDCYYFVQAERCDVDKLIVEE